MTTILDLEDFCNAYYAYHGDPATIIDTGDGTIHILSSEEFFEIDSDELKHVTDMLRELFMARSDELSEYIYEKENLRKHLYQLATVDISRVM